MFVVQLTIMKTLLLFFLNTCIISCSNDLPVVPKTDSIAAPQTDTVFIQPDTIVSKPQLPDTARIIFLTFDDGPLSGLKML